ncbi:MAG TPA: galactokinase [Candidatus Hydrogenedens sp.]|nr:galactokinase [Candidatus Hydrogenedens sp.]
MQEIVENIEKQFRLCFKIEPEIIVKAPGRVNIIGEHTDYNHGYVLPMALEQGIYIAGRKRNDSLLNFYATNMNRQSITGINCPALNPLEPWMNYIMGVSYELKKLGYHLSGIDSVIYGDVPIGCGLSSSAALEMATLKLFEGLEGFILDDPESARLGQRVENEFLGLKTGIMDQFISRCGKKGHALFLDCRNLNYDLVPVDLPDYTFVIANTNCPRGLTGSKYNERVTECEKALITLNSFYKKNATHLRDFTIEELTQIKETMAPIPYKRAYHVLTENSRVLSCVEVLKMGDVQKVGELLNESDFSLQKYYEVTNHQLEVITDIARNIEGCKGARMTGAGFGGCTINLVEKPHIENFINTLIEKYYKATGIKGSCIISQPSDGATIIKNNK